MSQPKLITANDLKTNILATVPDDSTKYSEISKLLFESLSINNKKMVDLILYAADMGSPSYTATQTTLSSQYFLNQIKSRTHRSNLQFNDKALYFDTESSIDNYDCVFCENELPFEVSEEERSVFFSRFLGLLNIANVFYENSDEEYRDMFDELNEGVFDISMGYVMGKYALNETTMVSFKYWEKKNKIQVEVNDRVYVMTHTTGIGNKRNEYHVEDVMNELYEFLEDYCGHE